MTTTRIAQGELEGTETDGVVRFAGIPYAAPVSGSGRFRPPAPAEPWKGVREATGFGPVAPQVDFMAMLLGTEPEPQSEDCHFLNVYTPGVDDARRPVMVWIHGGAYTMGSGSAKGYGGGSLARRGDVVVVTINYRLGALGFLHLAGVDASYPDAGNLGLLDQIAALAWVRDNIGAFGGDPDNVTIFGESAGAMSVGTLLGAPGARGLFHKAIPQSGAAHNVSPTGHAAEITEQFMASCRAASVADLLAMPATDIIQAQQSLSMAMFTDVDGQIGAGSSLRLPFQPVVDGVTLSKPAIDAVVDGNAAGVPVLIGTCRDEWNLFRFLDPRPVDEDLLQRRFGKLFGDGPAAVDTYRTALPGRDPSDLFTAAVTDLVFRQPAIGLAEAMASSGSPTYSYLFTWESPAMGGILGCCHALELPFVFGDIGDAGLAMLVGDDPPASLVDQFQESWLAFVRSGDPSNPTVGEWPTYTAADRLTMVLDTTSAVHADPEASRRALWSTGR